MPAAQCRQNILFGKPLTLLSLQLAGRQLNLLAAPGKNLQVLPDAQPVQLLAGKGPGACPFGEVVHLDLIGQLIQ